MSAVVEFFHLHSGIDALRIICALFFIPHIIGKFFEPAALGFFKAAKFQPPAFWMYSAGAIETVLAILLLLAIYPKVVGAIAAIHMMVAAVAVYRVTNGKWLWNTGGNEYCVFWALCCGIVAASS
jgi:putative oxidoreductase